LGQHSQTRPPGVVAPKPTHTVSRGDTPAPFIHGKERMPQRSTLYTAKVLAFTPQGFSAVRVRFAALMEPGNATRSDCSSPRQSGLANWLCLNSRQIGPVTGMVGLGPLCGDPCSLKNVSRVCESSTKFPFRLFGRSEIGTSRRFYLSEPSRR
jgi:hypothetical protein